MATGHGRITITPSNGVRLNVWRHNDLFTVERDDGQADPQICLGVDLFEVIADLAELDLESAHEADEATKLAAHAQDELPRSEDD